MKLAHIDPLDSLGDDCDDLEAESSGGEGRKQ